MRIGRFLLPAFIVLPLLEIFVLVKAGQAIGALNTVLLVVLAAGAGLITMRVQGFATALRVRAAMTRGELPGGALLDGVWFLLAGILLLIPGFVTDVLAVALFLPPVRRALSRRLLGAWPTPVQRAGKTDAGVPGRRTIEGEFTRRDD